MEIVFNLCSPGQPSINHFLTETGIRLPKKYPEHTFIFLTEHPDSIATADNIVVIPIDKVPSGAVNRRISSYRLSRKILKNHQPDFNISSLPGHSLPDSKQVLISQPSLLNTAHTKSFLRQVRSFHHLVVFSKYEKELLIQKTHLSPEKIEVIYPGHHFSEILLSIDEREALQKKYADENEFFVYAGSLSDTSFITTLLKAFSGFKKWSRSHAWLILTGFAREGFPRLQKSLESYRFRSSVSLLPDLPDTQQSRLVAAAYAAIFPDPRSVEASGLLRALACGTAVLAAQDGIYPEIAGDNVLYFDPNNRKAITDGMLRLFKEESLRSRLLLKSRKVPETFSWERSSESLWNLISDKANA